MMCGWATTGQKLSTSFTFPSWLTIQAGGTSIQKSQSIMVPARLNFGITGKYSAYGEM